MKVSVQNPVTVDNARGPYPQQRFADDPINWNNYSCYLKDEWLGVGNRF